MIDIMELIKGIDVDMSEHESVLYYAGGNTLSIIDEDTAELIFFDYLH